MINLFTKLYLFFASVFANVFLKKLSSKFKLLVLTLAFNKDIKNIVY